MMGWIRRLSTDSRSHLLVAGVAVAWAVFSQVQASDAAKRLDASQASQQAVGYGLWYALVQEQAKAGRFEGSRDAARAELSAKNYRLGVADAQLAACDATTQMATDDGWTGQVDLRMERTR
ncbi:hypothetical protein [Salinicola aestuarinus]|uniref:hypothetical protein n=1 Tax=Salinicola aestuarinus TaxID=1949082 RepID=UPI000DA25EED|nr:hypothetical protein [Salinicola aestuarinus]